MNPTEIMKIFDDTAYIRMGGTAEELRSAEYLRDYVAKWGVEAKLEPFEVQMATLQEASFEADGVQIPCKGFFNCGSGTVEAPFYYLRNADAYSLKQCKGKIVMIDTFMGYWIYQDLLENGAVGFITYDGNANYADEDIDQKELRKAVSNGKIIPGRDKLPAEADLTLKHGNTQTTKAANGFKFDLDVTPVVTGKASILPIKVSGTSLLGWNSNGTPRLNKSAFETEIQVGNEGKDFVIGGIKRTNVIRSVSGLPFLKDIPVLGWVFSTETETTRHSELVLIARAEIAGPFDRIPNAVQKDISGIVEKVTSGKDHPIRNLGFEQLGLDTKSIE